MNKATINKSIKKEEKESLREIQDFFGSFSSENKKSVELIPIIFQLKPKSEKAKLLERLILDKKFSISEVSNTQLRFCMKRILEFRTEFMKAAMNGLVYERKEHRAYLELITGIKSKKLDQIKEFDKEFRNNAERMKKLLEKYGTVNKIPKNKLNTLDSFMSKVGIKKYQEILNNKTLIIEAWHKKESTLRSKKEPQKLTIKQKKRLTKLNKKINKMSDKTEKTLEKGIQKLKNVEEQIQKISKLTDSCEHCYQKVSKTYQKNKLKKLEKSKKEITSMNEALQNTNSNIARAEFLLNDRKYLPFKDAKRYVNMLMLKSEKEWHQYAVVENKIPVNIPRYPHIEYRKSKNEEGWVSYSDWLGVKPKKIRSYKETKEFVKKMNIRNYMDWKKVVNSGTLPADIPRNPMWTYKKEWKGIKDFLNK